MTSKILLSAIAAIGLFFTSVAQTQSPPPPEAPTVHFRLMSWTNSITDLNYPFRGKAAPIPDIESYLFSPFYPYASPDDLVLFNYIKDEKGNPVVHPMLTVPRGQLLERSMILIFDDITPYKFQILDDGLSGFPAGGYKFVNFTPYPMLVSLDNDVSRLSAKGTVVVGKTKFKPGDSFDAKIATETSEGRKMVYSNRWMYGDKERVMMFVVENPTTKGIEVRCFTEDAKSPKVTPPAQP